MINKNLNSDANVKIKTSPNGSLKANFNNVIAIPNSDLYVIDCYIVGTGYGADWLSDKIGGKPITPSVGKIYVIRTAGNYFGKMFIWAEDVYLMTSSGEAEDNSIGYNKLDLELQELIDGKINATDEITENEIDKIFEE